MSRRQRRRTGGPAKTTTRKSSTRSKKSEKSNRRRGLWWKSLLAVVVVLGVGGFVIYKRAIAYLHSEKFRTMISERVSNEIGSKGEFGKFKWDGFSAETTGYQATGNGAIQQVKVDNIALDVDFSYVKRDVFNLQRVKIDAVEADLDLTKKLLKFESVETEKTFLESLLPNKVALRDAAVSSLSANIFTSGDDYRIEHVMTTVEASKKGKGFDIHAQGGRFIVPLPILEDAHLKQAKLRARGNEVYIDSAEFSVQESGVLKLTGFAKLDSSVRKSYEIDGQLRHLRCRHVFPPDWQKNLKGEVVADFSVRPFSDGLPVLRGHLKIKNGTLEALPVLNKIAYYLADSKYRTIRFQSFECDFEKFEDRITLSNIVLSSKGLLKIQGELVIQGDKLDGLFSVGLPPEKLSNIPGAETHVFLPGKEHMNWTKVKIGGTFDNITEDLSDRLIAAAGQRIIERAFEIGGEVIQPERVKQAKDVVGSALDVIKGDKSVADGVADGISGLLGNKKKPAPRPEKEDSDPANKEGEKNQEEKGQSKEILPIPIPDPRKIPDILPL